MHTSPPLSFPPLPSLHLPPASLLTSPPTVGYDPLVPAEEASQFGVEFMELDQIWTIADFVTLHVPLIPPTKGECVCVRVCVCVCETANLSFMYITNSLVRSGIVLKNE